VALRSFVAQMERSHRADLRAAIDRTEMAELQRAQITARIKQARTEAGLTQHEMAEALDVGPRTYQNYESEKAPRVPWNLLGRIAEITGKSSQWLIHGTPDLLGELGDSTQLDRIEASVKDLAEAVSLLAARLPESREDPPQAGRASA
jgi:transcriptional regulator with XRE-family HTH domain